MLEKNKVDVGTKRHRMTEKCRDGWSEGLRQLKDRVAASQECWAIGMLIKLLRCSQQSQKQVYELPSLAAICLQSPPIYIRAD